MSDQILISPDQKSMSLFFEKKGRNESQEAYRERVAYGIKKLREQLDKTPQNTSRFIHLQNIPLQKEAYDFFIAECKKNFTGFEFSSTPKKSSYKKECYGVVTFHNPSQVMLERSITESLKESLGKKEEKADLNITRSAGKIITVVFKQKDLNQSKEDYLRYLKFLGKNFAEKINSSKGEVRFIKIEPLQKEEFNSFLSEFESHLNKELFSFSAPDTSGSEIILENDLRFSVNEINVFWNRENPKELGLERQSPALNLEHQVFQKGRFLLPKKIIYFEFSQGEKNSKREITLNRLKSCVKKIANEASNDLENDCEKIILKNLPKNCQKIVMEAFERFDAFSGWKIKTVQKSDGMDIILFDPKKTESGYEISAFKKTYDQTIFSADTLSAEQKSKLVFDPQTSPHDNPKNIREFLAFRDTSSGRLELRANVCYQLTHKKELSPYLSDLNWLCEKKGRIEKSYKKSKKKLDVEVSMAGRIFSSQKKIPKDFQSYYFSEERNLVKVDFKTFGETQIATNEGNCFLTNSQEIIKTKNAQSKIIDLEKSPSFKIQEKSFLELSKAWSLDAIKSCGVTKNIELRSEGNVLLATFDKDNTVKIHASGRVSFDKIREESSLKEAIRISLRILIVSKNGADFENVLKPFKIEIESLRGTINEKNLFLSVFHEAEFSRFLDLKKIDKVFPMLSLKESKNLHESFQIPRSA